VPCNLHRIHAPGAPFHAPGACAWLLHGPSAWFHPQGAGVRILGAEMFVSSPC